MAGARGLAVLTGIALSVLLARSLGAEGYGYYLFALTIAQILAMPVLAGLPTLVTRQTAVYHVQADWPRLRGIIRWSFGFVAVSAGVIAVLGAMYFALSGYSPEIMGVVNLLALPLVIALAFMHVVSAILRGFEHVFLGSLPDGLIRPVLLLAFVGVAVLLGVLTPALAMGLHVAAACLAAGWAVWVWLRYRPVAATGSALSRPRFETRVWLASLLPLALITAAATINSRLDIFMLGILTDKESVAVYGLAFQIAGVVAIGQTIIYSISAPRIARMWEAGARTELRDLVSTASRLSFAIALVGIFGLGLLGPSAVPWLVGEEYGGTIVLAVIISLGILFSSAMGPAAVALNMSGHDRIVFRATALMAAVNTILNFLLIPPFGPEGAAIASVGSLLVYHLICVKAAFQVLALNTTLVQKIQR